METSGFLPAPTEKTLTIILAATSVTYNNKKVNNKLVENNFENNKTEKKILDMVKWESLLIVIIT